MYPGHKQSYYKASEEEYSCKDGSSMQMMRPNHCHSPPKHNRYNHLSHGYAGGHGANGYNYSESHYEKEKRYGTGYGGAGYGGAGYGANSHVYANQHSAMPGTYGSTICGPMGGTRPHFAEQHHKEHKTWSFKGIDE